MVEKVPWIMNIETSMVRLIKQGTQDSNLKKNFLLRKLHKDAKAPQWENGMRKTLDDEISAILRQIPRKRVREFYYGLIDLGSLVCKPKPNCIQCPLQKSCSYKTCVEGEERKKPKP